MPESQKRQRNFSKDRGKVTFRFPFVSWEVEVTSLARIWKPIALVFILLLTLAVVGWLFVRSFETLTPAPDLYAARIVVLDPEGHPVEDSEIRVSAGNEPQRVPGGWEVEIPRAKVPKDGKVTFWAEDAASGGQGSEELVLGDDPKPTLQIPLTVREATVRGTVVDPEGRLLQGAVVSVLGVGDEAVVTDSSGTFELPAHRPRGQNVRLHVEHPGFSAEEEYCSAGRTDCQIQMGETAP